MAVIILEDILDGTDGEVDSGGWKSIDRLIIVGGLSSTGWAQKADAAFAATGITIGNPHPEKEECLLEKWRPAVLSSDSVKLTLFYTRPTYTVSGEDCEIGASVVSVETNKDIDENEMFLSYTYPIGYRKSSSDAPLTEEIETGNIGHTATVMRPEGVFSTSKRIIVSRSYLKSLIRTYVGAVNSSTWDGDEAGTWLCTRIWAKKVAGRNTTYDVTYEFQYREKTWKHTALFIKDDGKPPYPTDENSQKTYKLYKEANFKNLNID